MSKKRMKRFTPSFLIILAVALLAGFFLFRYASSAIPGQILYPLKIQTEELLKQTMSTPDKRLENEIKLADKRLVELKKVKDDANLAKIAITNFNKHFDNIETYYEGLIKQGNNDVSFDYFEKANFSIFSFMKTIDASKKTYPKSTEYLKVIGEGSSRLNKSVDRLFEISVENFGDYQKFLKYALSTFESYQYPRVFQEIEYAKEDFDAIKPQASKEEIDNVQKIVDDFQAKYDDLMKNRNDLTVKQIYDKLKELKQTELSFSIALVEISKKGLEVVQKDEVKNLETPTPEVTE